MELKTLSIIISVVFSISAATWFVADTFATNDDLKLASTKAEVALDISIDSLIAKLVLLESKPKKTAYDLAKIKYLQDEISRLKKLRSL